MPTKKVRILSVAIAGGLAFTGVTAAVTTPGHAPTRAALAANTASPPPANLDNCPMLSEGYQDVGCVSQLQTELNTILALNLPVDGTFGPATKTAVETFQQEHNIVPADGIVGPQTKAALDNPGSSTAGTPPGQLNPGQQITSGTQIASPNSMFVLQMQGDGNLVFRGPGNIPLGDTHTAGHDGTIAVMQTDGNFVLRAPGNIPVWASGTDGHPGTVLQVQDDGNVVLYAPGHQVLRVLFPATAPTPASSAPTPASSAPTPASSAPTPASSAPTPASSAQESTASANPTQTCATLGEAGDDLSGSSEGDYSVLVGDPTTLVVKNTNVFPETVTFTPDGGGTQTATLWTWNSSHTFHLPAPGALQTPYAHSFNVKVGGVPYKDSSSAQMIGFVKSSLCQYQRLLTAAQVPGTGVAPATGTGSLSFKVHLSAPAPPIGIDNPDPFIISYAQQAQNGTADLANGITGAVTVPPGSQDATITVPVAALPPGSPADSMQFLLSGNDNHVPSPILFTGTITSTPAP